jgi:hypothetical protein
MTAIYRPEPENTAVYNELSRAPVVIKGAYAGAVPYLRPVPLFGGKIGPQVVVGQVFQEPSPYRDALRRARLYKDSVFSIPTGTGANDLSNYGDADYYSNKFGRYA